MKEKIFSTLVGMGILMIPSFAKGIETNYTELPVEKTTLYDIDNDGVKEWVPSRYDWMHTFRNSELRKFSGDFSKDYSLNQQFGAIKNWLNFGDKGIDGANSTCIFKITGSTSEELYYNPKGISIIDYDNDGTNEFLVAYTNEVLRYIPGRGLITERINILTPEEYNDEEVGSIGGNIGSGMSVVGPGSGDPREFGNFSYVDINNDGYPDFVDAASGIYLMNLGDGRFVRDRFGGSLLFRDFNGDSIPDIVFYDSETKKLSLVIQKDKGEATTSILLEGYACGENLWCRDFDGDGDVDILIPFDSKDNSANAFLIMFENLGKGNFKKHEYSIEGNICFKLCEDIDNDGHYEVIALSATDKPTFDVVSYKLDGLTVNLKSSTLLDNLNLTDSGSMNLEKIACVDVDNSGQQRIMLRKNMFTPTGNLNTAPARPAAPKVNYDESANELTVEWELGSDDETAALDLTYELRVGTGPDLCDILWSDSNPDGTRRSCQSGNCGYSLKRKLNTSSWKAGKVYVSLQVIDAAGMGSRFSDYSTFDKTVPGGDFIISMSDNCTLSEPVAIYPVSKQEANVSYAWDFDNANVISKNDTEIILSWSTPGRKYISLTATDAEGKSTEIKKYLTITPAKVVKGFEDAALNVHLAMDLDMDGVAEILTEQGFMEGDASGNYAQINKLFNSNLSPVEGMTVIDVNRDGLPDLYMPGQSNTSARILINEGDKSMRITQKDQETNCQLLLDLDNDGFVDAFDSKSILYRNSGDYSTFIKMDGDKTVLSDGIWYDFDGDGFVDNLKISSSSKGSKLNFYRNLGEFEFELSHTEELDGSCGQKQVVGDADGNGKPEIFWTRATHGFGVTTFSESAFVRWDDGTITEVEAPSGHAFDKIAAVFDFDNNGCSDLLIPLELANQYAIIFFHPDHKSKTYVIEDNLKFSNSIEAIPYRRSDGMMGLNTNRIIGPANSLPSAPAGLRASYNGKNIILEWDASSDAETPSASLKYNVSIKKADAQGENSYFRSPLNGERNGVPVSTNAQLLNSPKLTIPNETIAPGEYEVKVQAVDTQQEAGVFSETFRLKVYTPELMESLGISFVDIDENTSKHCIGWSIPEELTGEIENVKIHKATTENGNYEMIATVPADQRFIDNDSDPTETAAWYSVSFTLAGGETGLSKPHRPIHLAVPEVINLSCALVWNGYHGRDVEEYQILRGSSPSTLDYIGSCKTTSFTDENLTEGKIYYAIEAKLSDAGNTNDAETLSTRSNIVSVNITDGIKEQTNEFGNNLVVRDLADGNILIEGISIDGKRTVLKIYNIDGQIMHVTAVKEQSVVLSVDNLSPGLYLICTEGSLRQTAMFMHR